MRRLTIFILLAVAFAGYADQQADLLDKAIASFGHEHSVEYLRGIHNKLVDTASHLSPG